MATNKTNKTIKEIFEKRFTIPNEGWKKTSMSSERVLNNLITPKTIISFIEKEIEQTQKETEERIRERIKEICLKAKSDTDNDIRGYDWDSIISPSKDPFLKTLTNN